MSEAQAHSDPGTAQAGSTDSAATAADPVTASSAPGGEQASEVPMVEKARLDGAMRKLSEKDTALKALEAKIAELQEAQTSQATTWGAKEAELATQLSSAKASLQTLTGEKEKAAKELAAAQQTLVKYEALKGFPDLLPMADTIPSMPDLETMRQHLELVQKGVDEIAGQKARSLTAGVTPGVTTPVTNPNPAPYTTFQDWDVALREAAGTGDFATLAREFNKWHDQQTE